MLEIQNQMLTQQLAATNRQGPNSNGAKLQAGNGLASKQRRNTPSSRIGSQSKGKKGKKRFNAGTTGLPQQIAAEPGAKAGQLSSRVQIQ